MTSPLFLVETGRLSALGPGGRLRLDGEEGRHATTVRRITAGEPVDVADGAGALARCTVVAAGRDALDLEVLERVEVAVPSPRLVLVQALAKGGRDEQAVETATEVGVDVVVPWQAERSVVLWRGDRGERSRRRWESTARAAAKQARRARVPVVELAATTADVVRLLDGCATGLLLHEQARLPLAAVTPPAQGDVVVVVGPEGGISPAESQAFAAAGAHAVRLGPEVLRTSTAGPVALALLAARIGRWG